MTCGLRRGQPDLLAALRISAEDERRAILSIYDIYRQDLSQHLHATAARSVPRTVGPDDRFWDLTPDMLEGVTPDRLFAAYQKAITPRPTPVIDLFHVAPIRTSVIDAVADLCVELPRRGAVSFRELTSSLVDRLDVVVHFLAVLELFKQGLVDLHQPQTFGDIRISWIAGDSDALGDLALVDAYDG